MIQLLAGGGQFAQVGSYGDCHFHLLYIIQNWEFDNQNGAYPSKAASLM
jgi:hypothetical protein